MKNLIVAALAALTVLAIPALGVTDINLLLHQDNGEIEFTEITVGAYGYDDTNGNGQKDCDDLGVVPTAQIYEHIVNYGSLDVSKRITSFGTGDIWPNRNSKAQGYGDQGLDYGEWSLFEKKQVWAEGETWKNKVVNIWTVHPDWFTEYHIYEYDDTTTQQDSFDIKGTAQGTDVNTFKFEKHMYTDEPLYESEYVWINPWDEGFDPWDEENEKFAFPEIPGKPSVEIDC